MGLTVTQCHSIVNMAEQAWSPHETRRYLDAVAKYKGICDTWESDSRVRAFAMAYERATGLSWGVGSPSWMSSSRDQALNYCTNNWSLYTAGSQTGEMYDALADAGYQEKFQPRPLNFRGTPEAETLGIALRTTRKNWTKLSDPFAEFAVTLSLAGSTDDVLKAVRAFLDNLK